jgi:hypothetical protein
MGIYLRAANMCERYLATLCSWIFGSHSGAFEQKSPTSPAQMRFVVTLNALLFLSKRRGAEKSLAFPIFLFAAQPKEFFLDGLKKLEQRSHKCVELRGEYVE